MKINYKIQGDIKRYVNEANKKMFYEVKRLTNETRLMRTKIARLETKIKEIEDGPKKNDS